MQEQPRDKSGRFGSKTTHRPHRATPPPPPPSLPRPVEPIEQAPPPPAWLPIAARCEGCGQFTPTLGDHQCPGYDTTRFGEDQPSPGLHLYSVHTALADEPTGSDLLVWAETMRDAREQTTRYHLARGLKADEFAVRDARADAPAVHASDPETTGEWLRAHATDSDVQVRIAIAENRNTPTDVLETLATDDALEVRAAVADNPGTDLDTLRDLALDGRQVVVDIAHAELTSRGEQPWDQHTRWWRSSVAQQTHLDAAGAWTGAAHVTTPPPVAYAAPGELERRQHATWRALGRYIRSTDADTANPLQLLRAANTYASDVVGRPITSARDLDETDVAILATHLDGLPGRPASTRLDREIHDYIADSLRRRMS